MIVTNSDGVVRVLIDVKSFLFVKECG